MHASVGVWLSVLAVLLQLAALVVALPLCRRLRSPPLAALLLGSGALMLARRAISATSHTLDPLAQNAADTAVSLLLLLALTGLTLHTRTEPTAPPSNTQHPPPPNAVAAREEERELLSYDLHDGLAQCVLASQMHLDTFVGLRNEGRDGADRELGLALQRIREAVAEVRRVVANLTVDVSPETPLGDAIGHHAQSLAEAHGWRIDVDDRIGGRRFEPAVEAMVFRVVQEALNNAARHSATERVDVSLRPEGACLVASVRDWGRGFSVRGVRWNSRKLGLRSMCNRAKLIGGSCEIESDLGAGTCVTIRVPAGEGGAHGEQ